MYGKCVLAAVCALLTAALAGAQETTTGSIAGRVVDAQGLAVPGATVTVTTPQGPRTFTTDSDGAFFAPFLTPGMYEVKVELQGFRTLDRQNIEVRLGQRVELSLPLQVGSLTESVTVSGAAPVVDRSSTTTGAVLNSDLLQRIPVGRRFSDTLYIAPGVSSGGQVGEANPSMSGGSGLENLYVVDGVNITNAGYGALGSYSIVFGSLGNGVPFDFIKETQVKTGGYEAEFGRSFFPKSARELPAIYTAIAQELASQYQLGYMPARPGGDGAFRRVEVRLPPQTNALARTRSGYYASRTKLGM